MSGTKKNKCDQKDEIYHLENKKKKESKSDTKMVEKRRKDKHNSRTTIDYFA